jgi:polyisoprenoid-binding protein YceI
MRKITAAACVMALFYGTVSAQDISSSQMGAPDRSRLSRGSYSLDTHHTHIVYKVDHFGLSSYYGMFGNVTGELNLDPAHPEISKLSVIIPVEKVLSTAPALDAHLRTEDFFDVAKFPTAKFSSTKITPIDDRTALIRGNLTLRGKSRQIDLRGRFTGAAVHPMTGLLTVGFEASGRIKRSDFGIDYIVPLVSDEVDLTITAVFEKAR